uniref:Evasin n=1 Tax=Amblyomma cajennense TaxID=34607 RepID=A0A023FC02_AMBCJ
MVALFYTSLFCFMLLASHDFVSGDEDRSAEDIGYDEYEDSTEETTTTTKRTPKAPCPTILHLYTETDAKPLGCRYGCYYSRNMPDQTPCYVPSGLPKPENMTPQESYECPLGKCNKQGDCIPNGTKEPCYLVRALEK